MTTLSGQAQVPAATGRHPYARLTVGGRRVRGLVAAMTRRLLAEHVVVGLGVMAGKHGVARLYERLGFTHALDRTSVAPSR